jgi:hypothetical protein
MRRVAATYVAIVSLYLMLPGTAEAGWVIHSRSTGFDGKAQKEVSYFQSDMVRMEASGSAHVMNFASRKIIMVDEKKKKYSVMTFDEWKKMMRDSMRQAREAMDEMKRQGFSFPGAPSPPKGKISVNRISGATIAGYACDGYRVSRGKTIAEEIWVTKKIDLSKEFGPGMQKEFEEISRDAKKMGFDTDEEEYVPALRKIMESGYPMKTVDKQSGSVHEVTRVEKKAIAASLFEEPKGYEKVPFDRMTYGSSERMPSAGKGPAMGAAEGVGDRAADYGKQTDEEPNDAASRGAQEPVQEKKGDVLDSIGEGAKEGIKKLFKW